MCINFSGIQKRLFLEDQTFCKRQIFLFRLLHSNPIANFKHIASPPFSPYPCMYLHMYINPQWWKIFHVCCIFNVVSVMLCWEIFEWGNFSEYRIIFLIYWYSLRIQGLSGKCPSILNISRIICMAMDVTLQPVSQRRSYCTSVQSLSPMGLLSWQ